jgi:hypothetical protein
MTDVTEGGTAPAAWYGDDTGRHEYRYWDGSHWTDQVSDRGVVTTDGAGTQVGPPTPVPAHSAGGADVYSIGDIRITADMMVTPNGSAPLKGSEWSTRVGTRAKEPRPAKGRRRDGPLGKPDVYDRNIGWEPKAGPSDPTSGGVRAEPRSRRRLGTASGRPPRRGLRPARGRATTCDSDTGNGVLSCREVARCTCLTWGYSAHFRSGGRQSVLRG